MQIIGFSFTKITAYKSEKFIKTPTNTTIEFIDIEKEDINLLKDNNEGAKVSFKLSIDYQQETDKKPLKDQKQEKQGEVSFEGFLILSLLKEESKELHKSWKKKQMTPQLQIPLYNFILRKCSPKAITLEDEIGLPLHIPIPQLRPKPQE